MKRTIIFSVLVMLTATLSAQHVTPITLRLTEFNLDSLRAQYSGTLYLSELQRLDRLMKDDTKALKDAQTQFKAEKDYQKQMTSYIDQSEKAFKNLQTLSQKELDELKKLRDQVEKQQRVLNSTNQLNEETRSKSADMLQTQRRGLDATINATTSRQAQLAGHSTQLQQMRTDLMVFNHELINKETDLKQLETTLKSRRDIIKSETKNVKAQK